MRSIAADATAKDTVWRHELDRYRDPGPTSFGCCPFHAIPPPTRRGANCIAPDWFNCCAIKIAIHNSILVDPECHCLVSPTVTNVCSLRRL